MKSLPLHPPILFNMSKGIKSWAEKDRPREKMIEKGASALSDSELIAILLGSGSTKENAVDLARLLLKEYDNDLQKLSKQTIKSLCSFKGIKTAKAVKLMAALELGNRRFSSQTNQRMQIKKSSDAFKYIYPYLNNRSYEEFWTIFLDTKNCVITTKNISLGGVSFISVDAKKIYKIAFDESASKIILCHNHPSGDVFPGFQDKKLTHKIKESCRILDIILLDHIIVGNEQYYSFLDNNEL